MGNADVSTGRVEEGNEAATRSSWAPVWSSLEDLVALCDQVAERRRRELEAFEKQLDGLKSATSEAARKSLPALEQRKHEISDEVSQLVALDDRLKELQSRLGALADEGAQEQNKLRESLEREVATTVEVRATLRQRDGEVVELKAMLEKQSQQVDEFRVALEQKEEEGAKLRERVRELEAELESAREETERLKTDGRNVEQRAALLESELEQTTTERDRLFEELQKRSEAVAELERIVTMLSGGADPAPEAPLPESVEPPSAAEPPPTPAIEPPPEDPHCLDDTSPMLAAPGPEAPSTDRTDLIDMSFHVGKPAHEEVVALPGAEPARPGTIEIDVAEVEEELASPAEAAPAVSLADPPDTAPGAEDSDRHLRAADAAWQALGDASGVGVEVIGDAPAADPKEPAAEAAPAGGAAKGNSDVVDLAWINEQLKTYVGGAAAPQEAGDEAPSGLAGDALIWATPRISEAKNLGKEELRIASIVAHQPYTVEEIGRILSLDLGAVREKLQPFLTSGWIEVKPR